MALLIGGRSRRAAGRLPPPLALRGLDRLSGRDRTRPNMTLLAIFSALARHPHLRNSSVSLSHMRRSSNGRHWGELDR